MTPANLAAVFILTAGLTFAPAHAQGSTPPPSPLDLVEQLMGFHGGEQSPGEVAGSIFNTGVLANMRIPLEHLQVRFVDTRSGTELTRDDRRHILGQARQDWAYQLIQQVYSAFAIPGDTETLIDLFDAAAMASLRRPPEYLSIEFYDARTGPSGDTRGGVSGTVPDYIYDGAEGALSSPESGQSRNPRTDTSRSTSMLRLRSEWNDSRLAERVRQTGFSFAPESHNDFILLYDDLVVSPRALSERAMRELDKARSNGLPSDITLASDQPHLLTLRLVDNAFRDEHYFVTVLHLTSDDSEFVAKVRSHYSALYE